MMTSDYIDGHIVGIILKCRVKFVTYLFVHLFTSGLPQPYGGGILGMAFVGTVCSAATSGGINVVSLTPFLTSNTS